MAQSVRIRGAREHNLKNVDLDLPHRRLVVITGPSGSGKSSLAFDTLYAEGQRRYMASLSTYAKQFLDKMDKPDVDEIAGIAPTIAIQQKNPVKHSRSTVGTATEIYDYLRLLFAKVGKIHCPTCGKVVEPDTIPKIQALALERLGGERAIVAYPAPVPTNGPAGLRDLLLSKGFLRVLIGDELVDLSAGPPAVEADGSVDVVVDRIKIQPETLSRLAESLETAFREGDGRASMKIPGGAHHRFSTEAECCGRRHPKPTPLAFSFNNPRGACEVCKGFGNSLDLDVDLIVPNKTLPLSRGAIDPWSKPSYVRWQRKLTEAAADRKIDLDKSWRELDDAERRFIFEGGKGFKGIVGFFAEVERKKYKLHKRVFLRRYQTEVRCRACDGSRLRAEALHVRVGDRNIAAVSALTIAELKEWFASLAFSDMERRIAAETLDQIRSRTEFLDFVGLGYLTLDRMTRTLSGGEAQRIQLANQLGARLSGALYVLDEPSIGLHPRDTRRLVEILRRLVERGNTVVVVEHDRDLIEAADHVVELGPGSGEQGGEVVFSGPRDAFANSAETVTTAYLRGERLIHVPNRRRAGRLGELQIVGASGNNLKHIDVTIPLGNLVCVTGVSGSGKSTLIHDTLYRALARLFEGSGERIARFERLGGVERLGAVKVVDQSPIGKTPRSNPVTYMGAFSEIRSLFVETARARAQRMTSGMFSFNVPGGRCENCQGAGYVKVEMHFVADVYVRCPVCEGRRYMQKVLDVRLKGLNVHEVLELTVDAAATFFADRPKVAEKLELMRDVGLGYLRLGQPATTLSGGEAQRLKIAAELAQPGRGHTLYVLDEPTTGLHFDEVRLLIGVLSRLVDAGNSVVVIEHNMELVKTADHVIDLGPEGGEGGGTVVAAGTPEEVAAHPTSHTGRVLREALRRYDAALD